MKNARRRPLIRLVAALGLCAAGGLLLLAFAPLPVGWLVNAVAPGAPAPRVRVEGATLRLHPFGDGPTLSVRGLAVDQDGRPLARIARVELLAKKSELFHGRFGATIDATTCELTFPAAADPARKPAAPAPPPDLPALLAKTRALLAADPRAVVATIHDLRFSAPSGFLPAGLGAPALERLDLTLGPRPEGALVARLEIRPAAAGAPSPVVECIVAPDNRSATASVDLPASDLAGLIAFATPGRAPAALGRVAARVKADLDLVALRPGASVVEFDGDDLRLADLVSPGVSAPPPANVRLRLRANATFDHVVAERLELRAPGLELALPRLEVDLPTAADASLRLAWGLGFSADPARIWPGEWKSRLAALSPEAAALLAELGEVRADGGGQVALKPSGNGWRLERLEFEHTIHAQLGPTPLRLTLARERDTIQVWGVVLSLAEVNPAAGRAEGDASPLAALDLPLRAEIGARFTPELSLTEGFLSLRGGEGTLHARGPLASLGRDLAIKRIELAADSPDLRGVRVSRASVVSGDLDVELADSSAALRDDGRVAFDLRCRARTGRLSAWQAWLPASLGEALKPLGWTPADLALSCETSARGDFSTSAPAEATFESKGTASLGIGEGRLDVNWDAAREQAGAPISFALRAPQILPRDWPGRPTPDFAWSDLRLAMGISVEGRLEPPAFAPHGRVKFNGSGGSVVLPASVTGATGVEIPIRDVDLEARLAGDPLAIELPRARLRLGAGVELATTDVRLDLHGNPKASGRWEVAPLDLAAALTAWPAMIKPEPRARVVEHLKGGRLERLAGAFDVELPPNRAPLLKKAEADAVLADLSVAGSLLPCPASFHRAAVELRWPRLEARIDGAEAPGATISHGEAKVSDLTAASWSITTRVDDYAVDLAALPAVAGVPKGVAGRLKGNFSADAKLRAGAGAPDEFKFTGRVAAEGLRVPDLLGGAVAVTVGGVYSGNGRASVESVVDSSRLVWSAPELAGVPAPRELRAKATTELDAAWRPKRVELALTAPSLLEQAAALRVGAEWAEGSARPRRIELAEFSWGRTHLSGELSETADGPRAKLRASMVSVPELWAVAQPRWAVWRAASATKAGGGGAAVPASLAALFAVDVAIDRIDLGANRVLKDVGVAATFNKDGSPRRATLRAMEGDANRFSATVDVAAAGGATSLDVRIDDVPHWASALATPLRARPVPPEIAPCLGYLDTVIGMIAGGSLDAKASVPPAVDGRPGRLEGSLAVRDATLVRLPRVVALLALKSGKELQQRPLVRRLSIERVSLDGPLLGISGVTLQGTGLVDRLTVNKGSYSLADEKITLDGSYFGIGFEVDGTRAKPEVWLKDNLVIKAIGQKSELDFGK